MCPVIELPGALQGKSRLGDESIVLESSTVGLVVASILPFRQQYQEVASPISETLCSGSFNL